MTRTRPLAHAAARRSATNRSPTATGGVDERPWFLLTTDD
jgi:hypothetical protein